MNATGEQSLISKIKTLSPQQVAEVEDFVEFLAAKSKKRAAIDRRVVPSDADDDHVIAATVAAGATLIVSGDSDLRSMGRHQGY